MGRKWEKFCLLMWKNFLLQRRHPLQTIVEILAPVAFCSLLVVFRSLVDPTPHATIVYPPFEPSMEPIKNFTNNSLMNITWSPCNPHLEEIMNEASQQLGLLPSECFDNAKQMQTYLIDEINLVFTIGGVQFDDHLRGNVSLPKNLRMSIRFPGELRGTLSGLGQNTWKTNGLFAMYQIAGPRNEEKNETADPDYYGQGFLAVQQEVSYAIIKYFKNDFQKSTAPIAMRRFPYPAWIEDMLLPALQSLVGLIIMFSYAYTCINTVKVITMEKEKQLKEAMKIMGLPNWLHWTAWYLKSICLFILTAMLIVLLMKIKWYPGTDFSVFTLSDPGVIFLFLVIYSSATITFCFAISTFFSKSNTAATVAAMCWFLSFFPYSFMQDRYDVMTLSEKLLVSLFSNSGMAYGFQLMLMFEGTGEGFQWSNIWKTTTQDDTLMMGHVIIMLVIDTVLYLLIALYVEAVLPGDYGVAQVWYFPFSAAYWKGTPKYVGTMDKVEASQCNTMFEKEPNGQVGVSLRNLRKEYGKGKLAVKDLSMNMYKDQITVLLGHNGAGKTTTMSMLTGMLPPTSGTAIIGRYDIRMDMDKVRESLGLCPQHNILFDELTVGEHLYFYSKLKGVGDDEAGYEIRKYVELLQLIPKMHAKAKTLSGGMKRKLSVAIALCGDSKVVMCDEPTAGMDPSARRALWDLLQSQKKGRTILLTTHFMDEADLLGDRIAIMAGGELQCCGSSFFLKKKYGAGYHLIMDKQTTCDVQRVTDLLQKHIPGLKIENNIGSELTYVLNEDYASIFEEMLSDLETHSEQLQINSYGISLTTLEEVFMKVGADHGQEEEHSEGENSSRLIGNGYHDYNLPPSLKINPDHLKGSRNGSPTPSLHIRNPYLTGFALWKNQFYAMLNKKCLILLRSWVIFTLQNCIPVLFLILAILVAEARNPYRDLPRLNITLSSYEDTVTVYNATNTNKFQKQFVDMLQRDKYVYVDTQESLIDVLLQETADNPTHVRQHYIVGATFAENNAITAWFNNEPFHSPPLALKTTMDAIIKTELNSDYSIEVTNYPLPFTISTRFRKLAQGQTIGFKIALNLGFSMAFVSSFYVMSYIKERVCKIKHLQFVSGIQVLTYWGTSFLCDFITFTFTLFCIIMTLLVFQEDGFNGFYELARFSSVFWYFGYAMLPMMYLSSYLFQVPSTGYTRMSFINIFSGVAAFLIVQFLSVAELGLTNTANTLHLIFLTIPHYSFSAGIRDLHKIYAMKNLCLTLIKSCVDFDNPRIPRLNPAQCRKYVCRAQSECCTLDRSYYSWSSPGIGRNVVFSLTFGTICIAILLLIEYRILPRLFSRTQQKRPPPHMSFNANEDEDVVEEKTKIRHASDHEIAQYSLALRDLTKYYGNFLAVNNLCLGVTRYECFGLLGVNGAGKTTTFKMITGDVKMSYGDVWVNGIDLKQNMKLVHKYIGYCPQFDGLLDDLTGRETLTIFSMLRGITYANCRFVVEKLAKDFDFMRHIDKRVKEYSGGNKRKLSAALALVGDPDVLYFDEPTTGMDPATKRHLWNALCRLRDNGKCIILTSHSMEECEALCTRLAIMVNGNFLCIGSTQHLKSKYSEGYTLTVKIQKIADELDVEQSQQIQQYVREHFPSAKIREKHQELLTFYIADKTLPWSRMFGIMERGKKYLNIEDYSLGQCSLEQVFLTFTKSQVQVPTVEV